MSPSLGLQELPFELLSLIVSNFEFATTLLQLCLTCKRLSQYVKRDGYRTFLQTRFPFIGPSSDWQKIARFLVTLSRAWKRKAFIARDLRPDRSASDSLFLSTKRDSANNVAGQRAQYQSMGYQPTLDCFESDDRSHQTSGNHILAWGAGVELIWRVIDSEADGKARSRPPCWIFWKDPAAIDGRDDITNLSLLRPHQIAQDGALQAIIGRASGNLQHVNIWQEEIRAQSLDTPGRTVRSTHINTSADPTLAAGFDMDVVLYKPYPHSDSWRIESEVQIAPEDGGARTWTVKFLNDRRVATGRGPAFSALNVLDITSDGIKSMSHSSPNLDKKDSVYAIEPLPAPRGAGLLFLAAWYSGVVTAHDLRCPGNTVLQYEDPIDPGAAVYSLCSFANDRFVAGSGRHSCIKFFDLRKPGRHTYAVDDLNGVYSMDQCLHRGYGQDSEEGYNIFLNHSGRSRFASPVYSLTKASEYSSSFYAGLENRVVQLDLYSLSDPSSRPSPGLTHASRRAEPRNELDIGELSNLGLVEHTHSGAHSMLRQTFRNKNSESIVGWDPCWVKGATDESQLPYQNARQGNWPRSRQHRRGFRA